MKENSLISIIIPVYNSEKYIKRAINSVLQQSYSNWELILINDGSTDNSEIICKEFQDDNQITVFSQRNQGPSQARNLGIHYATGEFLLFLDSDDELPVDCLKEFISIVDNNIDIICGGYQTNNAQVFLPQAFSGSIATWLVNFDKIMQAHILQSPCSKIFRKSILNRYRLKFPPNVHYGEDTLFLLNYLENCNSISVINKPLYIINEREGSLSRKKINNIFQTYNNIFKNYYKLLDFFLVPNSQKLVLEEYYHSINFVMSVLFNPKNGYTNQERRLEIENFISDPFAKKCTLLDYHWNFQKIVITYSIKNHNLNFIYFFYCFKENIRLLLKIKN